jgi:hypothetical protein
MAVDHVADVEKLTLCPVMWHAVCKCGNWDKVSDNLDELRVWFSNHRKEEYEKEKAV